MQLTAQVLRQVEFGPERRGYNMSEVDDFLEKIAVAVDALRAEMDGMSERLERAERTAADRVGLDDEESIRRTLVLAQRTADLAVKEAQEEAARLLDGARSDAESIVSEARQSADRIGSEADKKLREEVNRLTVDRDRLRGEIDALVGLLAAERKRLSESLNATLGYVDKNLAPSPAVAALASAPRIAAAAASPPAAPASATPAGPSPSPGSSGAVPAVSGPAAAPAPDPDQLDSLTDSFEEVALAAAAGAATAAVQTIVEPDVDELEAAIAADAAAAAPSLPPRDLGRIENDDRVSRPSLMALPSLEDHYEDDFEVADPDTEPTSAWTFGGHADSPAS